MRHAARWHIDIMNVLRPRRTELLFPHEASWTKGVYHLYVVRVQDREALQAHLAKAGIGTGIHYPIPLHNRKRTGILGYHVGDFPVTERIAQEIVSLPMFPQLSLSQQNEIVSKTAEFLNARVTATR